MQGAGREEVARWFRREKIVASFSLELNVHPLHVLPLALFSYIEES
jgi:hypothetical protein